MCSELQLAGIGALGISTLTLSHAISYESSPHWCSSCTSPGACIEGNFRGINVTTLFGTPDVKPKRQFSMLPILTVLFLFSYGLMTLLIVEQGSTIQSQRTMIQLLLGDSTELSAIKAKAARQQALAAQAPTHPPVEAPTAQAPSTQAPTTQAEA